MKQGLDHVSDAFRVEHGPGRRIPVGIHVKQELDRVSVACSAWNTRRVAYRCGDSREAGARPREWRVCRVEHGPDRRIAAVFT